jgi:hypothetical protein
VDKFLYWIVTDEDILLPYANELGQRAIYRVAELYKRRLRGEEPNKAEWFVASDAAGTASCTGCKDAATVASAVSYAADAGAYSADPVISASCAGDAVIAAGTQGGYFTMREELLELIKAA